MSVSREPIIIGSSVPNDRDSAWGYARRLERRYYTDQAKFVAAHRRVKMALAEVEDLPLSRQRATAEASLRRAMEILA